MRPLSRRLLATLFLSILNSAMVTLAHASSLEKLLMPGPLIEGHAKYEESCDKCHASLDKQSQRVHCSSCHKEVAQDIKAKQGYHGRINAIAQRECKSCHSDHLGRDADIVLLVPHSFPHDQTDFPLKGRHRGVVCNSCHKQGEKHRQAPATCIACHKDDDSHRGNLGDKCQECHATDGWKKELQFDHDQSDFKLTGKHRKINCQSCHPAERYEKTPQQCIACHQSSDPHRGKMGKACDSCHTTESWGKSRFDHERETDYRLVDAHQKLKCVQCHTRGISESIKRDKKGRHASKQQRACIDCHSTQDTHQGLNGPNCKSCHNERKWNESRFDHQQSSGYLLAGKHEGVKCIRCHSAPVYEVALERNCYLCHKGADVHKDEDKRRCESCHNETGWGQKVRFDHDLTRFPLGGLHTAVVCEACHLNQQYRNTDSQCHSCHQQDDQHKGKLGSQCALCHNPNGWAIWSFNHTTQTEFELTGGHKGLSCDACHRRPSEGEIEALATQCVSCHREDDKHQGAFGLHCDRCHVSDSFDDLQLVQ